MKLVCSQTELNTALQLVSRAVASRPTHPVLGNVLLTADAGTGRLSLTGFDLSLGIQTSFNSSVETSGAVTLPSKLFGEIISKLAFDSPITLESDDLGEKVNIESKSGKYEVRGLSADEFPDLPLVETGTSLKINPTSFSSALKETLFSSSSDDAKQILTGVHLIFDGLSLEAAATDGHRLAVAKQNNALKNDSSIESNEKIEVTLPAKSLREVERFINSWKEDQDISLFYDNGQVVFIASNQVVTSRTLEGVYPNYNQLIPQEYNHNIEFDRKSFISSLERIAVLADQHNNVVKISTDKINNIVNITTDAQDVGSGSESLPINYDGEDVYIAFNVRYLLEGLKAIESERIVLKCNSANTPAVFSSVSENDNFIYLVMPVQVRN